MKTFKKLFWILSGAVALFAVIIGITSCTGCALLFKNIIKGGGFSEEWQSSNGKIYKDIPYGDKQNNLFDLYIPASADPQVKQGAILFIHGGSWNSGKRSDMDYACKRYAKAGYITATIEYSLGSKKHPEVNVFTMLDEIEACIEAIQKKTAELGYDVDKIALSGYSAGGHLALLYAYSRTDRSPLPIAFVFEKVGSVDFHGKTWGSNDPKKDPVLAFALAGKEFKEEMAGSDEVEKVINSVSPVAFVTSKSVPTLFAYGAKDNLVKPIHAKLLKEALEKAGVPHQYIEYPHSNHGLYEDPECRDEFNRAAVEFAKKYFGY